MVVPQISAQPDHCERALQLLRHFLRQGLGLEDALKEAGGVASSDGAIKASCITEIETIAYIKVSLGRCGVSNDYVS